uniref:Putative secreted peptide n=1 Tax=Anopheles braziliensis TaxID=58242 RepID=A0A2M3ZQ01_9DIPT
MALFFISALAVACATNDALSSIAWLTVLLEDVVARSPLDEVVAAEDDDEDDLDFTLPISTPINRSATSCTSVLAARLAI